MKTFTRVVPVIFVLVSAIFQMGCAPSHEMATGVECEVQFKRDLLGTHTTLPVDPTTSSINGARTSVSGKLVSCTEEWVVVDSKDSQIWIPRSNVLLISLQKNEVETAKP